MKDRSWYEISSAYGPRLRIGLLLVFLWGIALVRLVQAAEPASNLPSLDQPWEIVLDEDLLIEMVNVPAGSAWVGSPKNEQGRRTAEGSSRRVSVDYSFWIGKYEVTTQEYLVVRELRQYLSLVQDHLEHPVTSINWFSARKFCRKLTEREAAAGRLPEGFVYRLPTELEWEYACRAGTRSPYAIGEGDSLSSDSANFDGEYPYGGADASVARGGSVAVGTFQPNRWGIYDMHGNVWEWCLDRYGAAGAKQREFDVKDSEVLRSIRGGSWSSSGRFCRSASRLGSPDSQRRGNLGFRIVLAPVIEVDAAD